MTDGAPARVVRTYRTMLGDREVKVTTTLLGARYSAHVDNVDPGAVIGRAGGSTVEEAEKAALDKATMSLDLTRASEALRRSVDHLSKSKK